jgi:hypothetical protein
MGIRRVISIVGLGAVLLVAAACGKGDTGGTIDAGAGTSTTVLGSVNGSLALRIDREDSGDTATLSCAGLEASGSSWLADPAAAQAACQVITGNPDAKARLVNGPAMGIMCSQIYGGPEKATVTGMIDGKTVNTSFHRADGCGVTDWTLLQPLLGSPNK